MADDGRDGQLMTGGVAIQIAMHYERQKQYMMPAKVEGNGEKGIQWEFVMKGSSARPLRHTPMPRKEIAVLLWFA